MSQVTSHKFLAILLATILTLTALPAPTSAETPVALPTVQIYSYQYAYVGDVQRMLSGSGTIIDPSGIIVTNNHVIKDENDDAYETFEVCFTLSQEKSPFCNYSASLIAANKEMDIALLKIDPIDFTGNVIPTSFPFLSYKNAGNAKTGDKIQIVGYPNTGKETVTITEGQISGSSDENGVRYMKTDAAVSGGNSGGTALDTQGNFIGIPSFLISRQDNLGYILDLKGAEKWIDENKVKSPTVNEKAKKFLIQQKSTINKAKATKKYEQSDYPHFKIESKENWRFDYITRDLVLLKNTIEGNESWMTITNKLYPYKVGKPHLDKMFEGFDDNKNYVTGYTRNQTFLNGIFAHRINYNSSNKEYVTYVIPYGYSVITIDYDIDLQNKEKSVKAHEEILKTFQILTPAENSPQKIQKFTFDNPKFSVETTDDWFVQKTPMGSTGVTTSLLEFTRSDNADSSIIVTYDKLSSSEQQMDNKEIFEELLKRYQQSGQIKILAKKEDVNIGGLDGWSLTLSYEDKDGKIKKETMLYLRSGKYYFLIDYLDKDLNYDKYLPDFKKILSSFQFGEKYVSPQQAQLGSLNTVFKDLNYHRYEGEITYLKERDYMEVFAKGNFGPEDKVTKAQAIEILVEAKIHFDERKKNLGKKDEQARREIDSYVWDERSKVNFSDTKSSTPFVKYIRYAKAKGIIGSNKFNKFEPYKAVQLAEFLKMAFNIFEIPTWKPTSQRTPWYLPYMDKAYEKRIAPYALFDFAKQVTRGEFAFMLKQILGEVGEV
ncbi:MAG: trypsin-like peptidase domain-containing protein [Patescibacteria group bacterium]